MLIYTSSQRELIRGPVVQRLTCRPVTAKIVSSNLIGVAIFFYKKNVPRQLSWQSNGLKIRVSTVRFCPEAPCTCGNSSAVEHRLAKAGVASSNLVSRSIHSSIAQLVEQSAVNRSVVGSSPTGGVHSYKCLETRRVVRAGRRSTIGNRVDG